MNEEQKLLFNFGAITFFAGILIGVLIGFSIGRTGLPNISDGASTVASGIESAEGTLKQATAEHRKAETGVDSATKRAETIQRSIDETRDILDQYESSVDRCQQIIDRIYSRGEAKKTAN